MPVEPDTGRPLAVEGTPLRVETAEVGVSVALPLAAVVGDGVPLTVGDGAAVAGCRALLGGGAAFADRRFAGPGGGLGVLEYRA